MTGLSVLVLSALAIFLRLVRDGESCSPSVASAGRFFKGFKVAGDDAMLLAVSAPPRVVTIFVYVEICSMLL